MNYIYQLVIGLASGAFGAWVATLFALKRFYSEKWWEKRAAAFIELTDAIYQRKTIQEYYSELREFQRDGPEEYPNFVKLTDEQLDSFELAANRAMILITKYSQVGPLLITETASKLLQDYLKEERKVDYEVHFKGLPTDEAEDHLLSMTQTLFENILTTSKKELKA